ncbi:MAG TPA: Tm-1-like ATP-binding domain-containing protein, partial [Euzebya sp.]|nr:Tm-1-like ATP-binding domain-containing protein [Euzebya sp.]
RTSAEDMLTIAGIFAERLGEATGPVHVALPTEGLSLPNTPDGPFWDPQADAAFRAALTVALPARIPITTHAHHVDDPAFGRLVARLFLDLLKRPPSGEPHPHHQAHPSPAPETTT